MIPDFATLTAPPTPEQMEAWEFDVAKRIVNLSHDQRFIDLDRDTLTHFAGQGLSVRDMESLFGADVSNEGLGAEESVGPAP